MTAEQATQISFEHSKRIQKIYEAVEKSAKSGNHEVAISHWEATGADLEVLRRNGFTATYETHEIDGGQYILIKWAKYEPTN